MHNNNFNLMRMIAAFSVLLSHSYALTSGNTIDEPFRASLGISLGGIALDVFFVMSGFLVGGSIFQKNKLLEFFISRVLRIYPALIAAMALTVFVLGPIATNVSAEAYFLHRDTWIYLIKNCLTIFSVSHSLPGVFTNNPYANAVNGSLWTLPYELWMYALLAIFWLITRDTKHRPKMVVLFFLVSYLVLITTNNASQKSNFAHLFFSFFSGLFFWFSKEKLRFHIKWAIFLSIALSIIPFIEKELFPYIYPLALPYVVLTLATTEIKHLKEYNKLGDYSFGMYIYAFPIQQAILSLHRSTPMELTAYAGFIAFIFSYASWHLIEKYAIEYKYKVMHKFSNPNLLKNKT